jgi:hypothetical protein
VGQYRPAVLDESGAVLTDSYGGFGFFGVYLDGFFYQRLPD